MMDSMWTKFFHAKYMRNGHVFGCPRTCKVLLMEVNFGGCPRGIKLGVIKGEGREKLISV